jgi:hypothetical protein
MSFKKNELAERETSHLSRRLVLAFKEEAPKRNGKVIVTTTRYTGVHSDDGQMGMKFRE